MDAPTEYRGADLLIDCLAEHGVQHLFGMPGSHVTTIYDAIRLDGRIQTILIRNEQAAAYAADGYARATGRPGVICTTAGPGATNALSGIAEAYADGVPILLLAGQVNSERMYEERGAYHEIDLESIFRPVTKWRRTLRDPVELPHLVAEAFLALTTGRRRPAVLILPQDLMRRAIPASDSRANRSPAPASGSAPSADAVRAAVELLDRAERPLILAGGGVLAADAANEVRALAVRLRCPVITSLNGKGLLDERDPLSLGHARSERAQAALVHADAMLAIGCRFTEVLTRRWKMTVPANLVQIDLDSAQIGMNYPVKVGVVADARVALKELLSLLAAKPRTGWDPLWEQIRLSQRAPAHWLIDTLRAALSDDAVVFADACELGYQMHADWPAHGPRTFFYPSNYIALGWGFPAAVGAAVARGEHPTVAICGDGGFVMNAQELATAVRYQLQLTVIVHNDGTFGAIKNIQRRLHADRFIDVALTNPDFLQLAAAYSVPATRVQNARGLSEAVRHALPQHGPTLIEVPDEWRNLRT